MVGCKNSQMSFFLIPFLAFSLLYQACWLIRSYIDPRQILNEDNDGKRYSLFSENTRIRKDWTSLKQGREWWWKLTLSRQCKQTWFKTEAPRKSMEMRFTNTFSQHSLLWRFPVKCLYNVTDVRLHKLIEIYFTFKRYSWLHEDEK